MVFSSPYKGGTRTWSNKWFLTGPDWADQTHFNTLSDEYVANAKTWITSNTTITETIGYNGGSDLPVLSKTYSQAGTASPGTHDHMPLEAAMLVRGSTTQRSSKNHPIYIMKYIHGVCHDSSTASETPLSGQKSSLQGSVNEFVSGVSDGTNSRKWAGPGGAVVQAGTVETYVTHRDFPT